MLQLKHHIISPYFKNKNNIIKVFEPDMGEDDYYLKMMDKILENNDIIDHGIFYHDHENRILNNKVNSDIILGNDNQHKAITENLRKDIPSLGDLRKIFDYRTKFHLSIARGYEKWIIENLLKINDEYHNRLFIKI